MYNSTLAICANKSDRKEKLMPVGTLLDNLALIVIIVGGSILVWKNRKNI